MTVPPSGAWRASDLEGKDVYDTTGEKIGSISDVLLSEDGEVIAVLVGVGGFLGIGQKYVAVAISAVLALLAVLATFGGVTIPFVSGNAFLTFLIAWIVLAAGVLLPGL